METGMETLRPSQRRWVQSLAWPTSGCRTTASSSRRWRSPSSAAARSLEYPGVRSLERQCFPRCMCCQTSTRTCQRSPPRRCRTTRSALPYTQGRAQPHTRTIIIIIIILIIIIIIITQSTLECAQDRVHLTVCRGAAGCAVSPGSVTASASSWASTLAIPSAPALPLGPTV